MAWVLPGCLAGGFVLVAAVVVTAVWKAKDPSEAAMKVLSSFARLGLELVKSLFRGR
ncbi:hypothetical protein ORV05_34495 [Amycolatopsis cynarae]|uniref:Uncharacterized protein n=1 Tax=Amycolatopsis cynarae TaxID=2995223 RepID=A0ABY7B1R9_9PSEU|nr:hypothetical protein [Amycolatopsis sp. HUAS 11-8]WAL65909.1 hypothetical protein ORV05_34495 [Amycolatopsis sp. HUAS 11-8]